MKKTHRSAAVLMLAAAAFLPSLAAAQGIGGGGRDPFSAAVDWFVSGPARGVAMLGIAAVAVALWFLARSPVLAGCVLAGGLILGNIGTIVGFMGF